MNAKSITVGDVMRTAATVLDSATFQEALKEMIKQEMNSVLVVDGEGKLVGSLGALALIKEVLPDYVETDQTTAHFTTEKIFNEDVIKAKDKKVSEFMNKDIKTLSAEDPLMEAAVLSIAHRQSRTPVLDKQGKPIGVITRTELKKIIGQVLGIDSKLKKK